MMKAIKTLMIAVLATFGLQASAQTGSNTFYLQFNPITAKVDIPGQKDKHLSAIAAGYSHAFAIANGTPLFVEAGANLEYGFKTEDMAGVDVDYSMLSVKVPVNLVYEFQIPNSSIAIDPYAGLRLRGILMAKQKGGGQTINYFDKDDMAPNDTFKRLQVGAQFGVNAKISNTFLVGAGYGFDFSKVHEYVKFSEFNITLGWIF